MPPAAVAGTIEFSILIRPQTPSNRFLPCGKRLRPTSSRFSLSCACWRTLSSAAHFGRFAGTRRIYSFLRTVCTRQCCEEEGWRKSENRLFPGCIQRGGRRCQHQPTFRGVCERAPTPVSNRPRRSSQADCDDRKHNHGATSPWPLHLSARPRTRIRPRVLALLSGTG